MRFWGLIAALIVSIPRLAGAAPKPVPQALLQGNRLVVEKDNFAIEAPRFDFNWKLEENRDGTMYICEASDPLNSHYVFVSRNLKATEKLDEKVVERELRSGLKGAGVGVEGMTVYAVRPGVSYDFVATGKANDVVLNAVGVVAIGGSIAYTVFQFQQTTTRTADFQKLVSSFTLLKDPGAVEPAPKNELRVAYYVGQAIGALLLFGGIGAIWHFTRKKAR